MLFLRDPDLFVVNLQLFTQKYIKFLIKLLELKSPQRSHRIILKSLIDIYNENYSLKVPLKCSAKSCTKIYQTHCDNNAISMQQKLSLPFYFHFPAGYTTFTHAHTHIHTNTWTYTMQCKFYTFSCCFALPFAIATTLTITIIMRCCSSKLFKAFAFLCLAAMYNHLQDVLR